MKKILLFGLSTILNTTFAFAEHITNIDTPVKWSFSAIREACMEILENKNQHFYDFYDLYSNICNGIVEECIYKHNPISIAELCVIYERHYRKNDGGNIPNGRQAIDFINLTIKKHNNIVQYNNIHYSLIDPNTEYDKPTYWYKDAVEMICLDLPYSNYYNCINQIKNLPHKENILFFSPTYLLDFCMEHIHKEFHQCDKVIIQAIDTHNKALQSGELSFKPISMSNNLSVQ